MNIDEILQNHNLINKDNISETYPNSAGISNIDRIKSAMREFAQLQAKEAIEELERYNEAGVPLDMDAVIKYIKLKFDIK